jgi:hypothetical protein
MAINDESGLTDHFLYDLETRCQRDSQFPNGETILRLIAEVRRLKTLLLRPKRSRQKPPPIEAAKCKAMRTLAGQSFRCTAVAKYGDYCGLHKPKLLKGKAKGCTATSRSGHPCKAIAMADSLCPSHWEKLLGHDYVRDGPGYRCRLCGSSFDHWAVEGRGRDRRGSIKRIAKCPAKVAQQ